jgi:hypothetical protein
MMYRTILLIDFRTYSMSIAGNRYLSDAPAPAIRARERKTLIIGLLLNAIFV